MKRTTPARKKVRKLRKECSKERVKQNELGNRRDQSHPPNNIKQEGRVERGMSEEFAREV